jgi:lipoprotein-anchoring transpeptidase ErfK/SrfK
MKYLRNLRVPAAAAVTALLLAAAGCSGAGSSPDAAHSPASGPASANATAPAKPKKHHPTGPPMQLQSIAPLSGASVGVAMPISIVFTDPVASSARARIERHLELTTSSPVTGAWHWFSPRRVDFRPQGYWTPGTTVSLVAKLDHVGDGNGRYGTHAYTRTFTIGDDVRTHVYVQQHKTVVTRDGKVLRTMLSDAGSPDWPSWNGTMAVVSKSRTIRMTSCSVGIACKKSDPDFYDLTLPWDVRLTWSGTFVHYSTGDPHPGHSYGSHGCVHLSYADAKWFYDLSKQGDPITITGSPRGKASGDNGYADYDLTWSQWLTGSAAGQVTTRS